MIFKRHKILQNNKLTQRVIYYSPYFLEVQYFTL